MPRDTGTGAAAAEPAADGGGPRGHLVARAVRLPVVALQVVARDLSGAARRPETVVYWGGLAGLAALGVLDWPVAAAVGVGVAVAGGMRRAH